MTINSADIRNIALVGHGSVGKTTLGEALLFNAKETTRLNRVDDKNSVLDFTDEEIARTITIGLKVATLNWNNKTINLLDTPGFPDFYGEVVSASKVADTFGIVIDATTGVDLGTDKAWALIQKEGLAGIFILNKMTRENIEYEKVIEDIKNNLTSSAALIQLPIGEGPEFKGVVDLVSGKAYEYNNGEAKEIDIPANMKDKVEELKQELLETIASSDEELMNKFFEDALSEEDIQKGFLTAIKNGEIYPICFADAHANVGVDKIMDVFTNYCPSPLDTKPKKVIDTKTNEEIEFTPDKPFSGFVFKTTFEKHVGEMMYIRVFSGTLKSGMEVYNPNKNSNEKINQIYKLVGKDRKEIDEIPAGGIGALVKLKSTKTNDTLCDKSISVKYPPIEFPKTNVSMAIIPLAKGDEEKISNGLSKLSEEDPSFQFNFDPEIKQTLIHGLGTIHLEVIINKLKEKFGVNVTLEKPKIKYRETIKKKAEAEGKHKKQSGGRGQFGVAVLRFEPLPRGGGFEFVDEIFGGAIPAKFVPSVEKGVKEAFAKGYLAGYPIVDVKVTVFDGKFHPVDSSDIAFQIAASLAVKAAMENANPILLEPIMKVEVIVPEEYMGDIMGDLNSRRGRILGMEPMGKNQKINALVPESEMYQYSSQLRSMTQGRGTFSMEYETYEEVPKETAKKIIEEAKKEKEEEK